MAPAEQSELEWLAFRYVAGELTADEAGAFEERLASDQEAREAVSRTVELTERLAEAAPALADELALSKRAEPKVGSVWSKSIRRAAPPLAWMAAGAAAAVLIASLLRWPARPPLEPGTATAKRAATAQSSAADAALWARLQAGGDWASPDLARWLEEPTSLASDGRDDSLDSAEVPSWIFAATNSRPK